MWSQLHYVCCGIVAVMSCLYVQASSTVYDVRLLSDSESRATLGGKPTCDTDLVIERCLDDNCSQFDGDPHGCSQAALVTCQCSAEALDKWSTPGDTVFKEGEDVDSGGCGFHLVNAHQCQYNAENGFCYCDTTPSTSICDRRVVLYDEDCCPPPSPPGA